VRLSHEPPRLLRGGKRPLSKPWTGWILFCLFLQAAEAHCRLSPFLLSDFHERGCEVARKLAGRLKEYFADAQLDFPAPAFP
jgi:hypothetical protein